MTPLVESFPLAAETKFLINELNSLSELASVFGLMIFLEQAEKLDIKIKMIITLDVNKDIVALVKFFLA